MKKSTIYVTPDHKYHSAPVDGAVEKILLEAENGKVLHKDSEPFNYLSVAVDTVDGWAEIDAEPEPLTDEEALTRYANELTGANDPDLISAAETLITDRIKEES